MLDSDSVFAHILKPNLVERASAEAVNAYNMSNVSTSTLPREE